MDKFVEVVGVLSQWIDSYWPITVVVALILVLLAQHFYLLHNRPESVDGRDSDDGTLRVHRQWAGEDHLERVARHRRLMVAILLFIALLLISLSFAWWLWGHTNLI